MELIEALKTRRSIRRFKSEPVSDDLVWEILELANAAPSAGNLQAREFILVRDPHIKKNLATSAHDQNFIAQAPVVLVVCGNLNRSGSGYGGRGREFYSIQDADAAIMHILLTAHAKGLGTCWVGAFDDKQVSSVLALPPYIRPIAILPLGYPASTPSATSRIDIKKLVHFDKW